MVIFDNLNISKSLDYKIIFLDIDGVLNCENGYKEGFCDYKHFTNSREGYQSFYPPSKNLLNKLVEETKSKIVISSSWRKGGLEWMRKVWEEEKMNGEIIGVTPSLYLKKGGSIVFHYDRENEHPTPKTRGYSIPRGCEIEYWSKDFNGEIENYVIIDDDTDMLYHQRNNFVHV